MKKNRLYREVWSRKAERDKKGERVFKRNEFYS